MKSLVAVASHSAAALSASRRSVVRLLGIAPAALLLAGSALTLAPAPARASSGDHLYAIQDDGQFARSGTSYQISVYASSDSLTP